MWKHTTEEGEGAGRQGSARERARALDSEVDRMVGRPLDERRRRRRGAATVAVAACTASCQTDQNTYVTCDAEDAVTSGGRARSGGVLMRVRPALQRATSPDVLSPIRLRARGGGRGDPPPSRLQ